MIIISTSTAIEAADDSANKPAKINVLVQLCLYITRGTPFTKSRMHPTEPTNDPGEAQLSANTKRPIGRFDLVNLLVLLAGHKSERATRRLNNNAAG